MRASKAFNLSQFAKIEARHETDFDDFGTVVSIGKGEGSAYTFRDNGSNVLGVAHVDTVQSDSYTSVIKVKGESVLLSPRLDDRLGVYIITRLLPRMGVNCDWLLTTGEETGNSSAEIFRPSKQYNWAFSFDRAGVDCVLYHYECKALKKLLRSYGFHIGNGSFSDLSFLDANCSGINFGCGYQDAHSLHSYAFLNDTFKMCQAFKRFYVAHKDTRLPYKPSERYCSHRSYQSNSLRAYNEPYGYSQYLSEQGLYGSNPSVSVYGSGYGVQDWEVNGGGEGNDGRIEVDGRIEPSDDFDALTSEDWERVNEQILEDLRREGK